MIPIQELLSRIRWDREYGEGRFEIGYYDRRQDALERVAFQEIAFPAGERQVFEVTDDYGRVRRIPFHRVREVVRNGQVVWRRPASEAGPGA